MCYKLLERIILHRISPAVDEILNIEQAGFRPGRSTQDQVLALTTREEASIFAPQRIPFYKDPRVAACTVGKVRSSTVFMCVCGTFRPSGFLLFVKNGFVVGVRCQGNREPPADSATTPLSQRHSWLGSP